MLGETIHLLVISQQAPETQQICHYRYARKTIGLLLLYDTSVDFSFRNNFAYLGSFAKVFASLETIVPWSEGADCMELWHYIISKAA